MQARAVLYLRSSKDRSDVSIDAQRRALHQLAVERGLTVADEFADAVESGKDEDRPAFQRLLAALKATGRTWQHILVLDTSRIARRRLIAMIFEGECSKRGVKLTYKSLPESDPATDMVLRSVLQAFDEYHSLISRAKGLAGMAENVRQGWRAGGKAPRGYRLEYVATGAVRDGMPVQKSRLVLDDEAAPVVRAYLVLRAQGVPRGPAIARTGLPWPAASAHSMDWQALTYAGHTVWNMHADRAAAHKPDDADKRRPRAEWLIQRGTHQALISDDQAEAILHQLEAGVQGRRMRASPRLLTGILVTPDGKPWHSDGCGYYRVGKGPRVQAAKVEAAVLHQLERDLAGGGVVAQLVEMMRALDTQATPIDGRAVAGIERRLASLATQIARTVDLAAQAQDPAPILRRVADLEHQRATLADQLLGAKAAQSAKAKGEVTPKEVRGLLAALFEEIRGKLASPDEARLAIAGVCERIELPMIGEGAALVIHYAVSTGDSVASPRPTHQSPPLRLVSQPVPLPRRRVA